MKTALVLLLAVVVSQTADAGDASRPYPAKFNAAIELIHSYSGAGNELVDAQRIADDFGRSNPRSGYREALMAEELSTWELGEDGSPTALRQRVLELTDKALHYNPRLSLAYVARARALLRASQFEPAREAIASALAIEPKSHSALFLQADLSRRSNQFQTAEAGFRQFIDQVPSSGRKANGYHALGKTYIDQLSRERPDDESALIAKARDAYQHEIDLDPQSAWRNVNFAILLNNYVEDFSAAENYAQAALNIMEFPMARMQLAIARYQQLFGRAKFGDYWGLTLTNIEPAALKQRIAGIEQSTGVSLMAAARFEPRSRVGHRLADMLREVGK